jgi:hypothetical protein
MKNPDGKIFFFVNTGSKLCYIHMSELTNTREFLELFPG